MVLDHQWLTLLVAVVTLVVTVLLYIVVPKGFFPVQDTGVIQGISVAAQTVSFAAMAQRQQELADVDPEGPRRRQPELVHRRGRQQHDAEQRPLPDQPEAARTTARWTRPEIGARIQQETADVAGHHAVSAAGAGPDDRRRGQPHAVPVRAGRPEPGRHSPVGAASWWPSCSKRRELRNVASDLQSRGWTCDLVIDRDTAARFGITPATVDNALYDAFGQRIISTIFTQSNQYRVILEADPIAAEPRWPRWTQIYLPSVGGDHGQVPLSAFVTIEQPAGAAADQPSRPVPGGDDLVRHGARASSLGDAVTAISQAEQDIGLPASFITASRARRWRSRPRCPTSCC